MKALKVDSDYLDCEHVTGAQKMQKKGQNVKKLGRERGHVRRKACVRMGE